MYTKESLDSLKKWEMSVHKMGVQKLRQEAFRLSTQLELVEPFAFFRPGWNTNWKDDCFVNISKKLVSQASQWLKRHSLEIDGEFLVNQCGLVGIFVRYPYEDHFKLKKLPIPIQVSVVRSLFPRPFRLDQERRRSLTLDSWKAKIQLANVDWIRKEIFELGEVLKSIDRYAFFHPRCMRGWTVEFFRVAFEYSGALAPPGSVYFKDIKRWWDAKTSEYRHCWVRRELGLLPSCARIAGNRLFENLPDPLQHMIIHKCSVYDLAANA